MRGRIRTGNYSEANWCWRVFIFGLPVVGESCRFRRLHRQNTWHLHRQSAVFRLQDPWSRAARGQGQIFHFHSSQSHRVHEIAFEQKGLSSVSPGCQRTHLQAENGLVYIIYLALSRGARWSSRIRTAAMDCRPTKIAVRCSPQLSHFPYHSDRSRQGSSTFPDWSGTRVDPYTLELPGARVQYKSIKRFQKRSESWMQERPNEFIHHSCVSTRGRLLI